jgi:diguanylate cyclase (GGDEF)-like protein/PAS domain S-box-containing protein
MKTSQVVSTLFITAAILVSIIIAASFYTVNQNEQAGFERRQTLITMKTSARLFSNLKDAETGQRGFLLTGENNYLEPYWEVHDQIDTDLKVLRDIMQDDPIKILLLNTLQPKINRLMESFSTTIKLIQDNRQDDAFVRLMTGADKLLMDKIRTLLGELEENETFLLAQRDELFKNTLSRLPLVNTLSIMMMFLMAILSSWFFYHESHRRIFSQKEANRELEQSNLDLTKEVIMRQNAEIELGIAATAFETQEATLVTDAELIILRVNTAFTRVTGFSSQETVGQTPHILSSGKHNRAFLSKIWDDVACDGSWAGRVFSRHKSGTIYPGHLTITSIKNNNGNTVNYVSSLIDISERVSAEDEIKHLAFYDHLTKLPNRKLFTDRLAQSLKQNALSGKKGALLFIDLDDFKTINDTLGHDIGDLLLKQVAERLLNCVRDVDTVARLGGDEFVVMLEELNDSSIATVAQYVEDKGLEIIRSLNQIYLLGKNNHSRYVTPSIGVTLFSNDEQSIEELLKQADIAMYKAKEDGRNMLRFFDPAMQTFIVNNASLEIDLRDALQNNQLQLFYQLQITDNKPTGAEALIRWRHPELGMIMPVQFITLAEETGLIIPIGNWVLKTACDQLHVWASSPLTKDLTLSINVSARQFHQINFVESVQSIIAKSGLKHLNKLKFELTESAILDNVENTILKMNILKKLGLHFSMDDFGTGYSSLSYLTRLPFNQIKIDQSFVQNLGKKHHDNIMVQTIIGLARDLNLEIIAEGVETDQQRLFLAKHGCNNFQGYLFSKPVPLDEFEQLI